MVASKPGRRRRGRVPAIVRNEADGFDVGGPMSTDATPLATLLQRHIDAAHGGNQAECARALGISPQHLGALMNGKIRTPRAELRRRLCLELNVGQLNLLALTGEIDGNDPELPPHPSPTLARIFALLRDPRLDARQLDAFEQALLDAIHDADHAGGNSGSHAATGSLESLESIGSRAAEPASR